MCAWPASRADELPLLMLLAAQCALQVRFVLRLSPRFCARCHLLIRTQTQLMEELNGFRVPSGTLSLHVGIGAGALANFVVGSSGNAGGRPPKQRLEVRICTLC